ncbi:MAG TPA: hypothetical protein DHV12_03485 [Thermotogae bacterium]|nr:hypothetical protein [Thermotogota bacterium]
MCFVLLLLSGSSRLQVIARNKADHPSLDSAKRAEETRMQKDWLITAQKTFYLLPVNKYETLE